jgi:S-(hydroxymethyl)glutathione dehydrogenase / alcohol dehydrogenase
LRTRAALLPETGASLRVVDVELDPPKQHEVLVRLHASGVCHSDQNAIDGTAETRCPAVLGHEGAGVVEAVGPGVTTVAAGDRVALSWLPACGVCDECRRELPHLCAAAFPAMDAGGLLDGTTRLSHDGRPAYHYSLLSTFAEHTVVPEASCIPIPADVPFDVAALVGCAITTGVCAAWRTARVAPGERVAVFGCGGVGLSAVMGAAAAGAAPIVAVDVSIERARAAAGFGATAAVAWAGDADATGAAVQEASGGGVDHAFEATGRPEAMRAAFLSVRPRGQAVLMGIPRADAELRVPARLIPRGERRVIGALYGSARPERDFGLILDAYRRGRLPLDRLISHRLPLERIEDAFALLREGGARRAVLVLGPEGAA